MGDRIISRASRFCAGLHLAAWVIVAAVWAINWWRAGPAPSGPLYYDGERFIHHIDILVYGVVYELTINISATAAAWLGTNTGACLTVTFAGLILLFGTVQWFLLGKLVQWVSVRSGRVPAIALLGLYGLWVGGATFLWLAS